MVKEDGWEGENSTKVSNMSLIKDCQRERLKKSMAGYGEFGFLRIPRKGHSMSFVGKENNCLEAFRCGDDCRHGKICGLPGSQALGPHRIMDSREKRAESKKGMQRGQSL